VTTWVLLRGLTRDRRHWGRFPEAFSDVVADAHVVALDFPGNGARNRETSPLSVAAMADACRTDLLQRGLRPPYHVLAMSLGAMATVNWATRYPADIARCVLINTSLRGLSPLRWRMRPANYPTLLRLLVFSSPENAEAAVLCMTSRKAARSAAVLDQWRQFARAHPVRRANALRQLVAAARFHAPAAAPSVPTLLLASRNDALVDVRCSRSLAAAWRLPLVEHPSAGHDLPLDDPEWVAGAVAKWLRETAD